MADYLVGQGRRRIAMITGPMDTPGGIQRLEGFADVLGRKASSKLVAHGDWTQASGERAMTELLERAPDLDAVFVASDLMAAGALTTLRAAGRAVPGRRGGGRVRRLLGGHLHPPAADHDPAAAGGDGQPEMVRCCWRSSTAPSRWSR